MSFVPSALLVLIAHLKSTAWNHMRKPMIEFYYLLLVYKFVPVVYKREIGYAIRLHNPTHTYWTEYETHPKFRWCAGVDPFRIFKRNRGIPKL